MSIQAQETGPAPQAVAALLALSDERDAWQRLAHAAYRQGYRAGARGQYDAGYAAAIADVKRTWHEVVDAVHLAGLRLAPAGDAWLWSVLRHGATEYGGKGKPRVPADPAAITSAWQDWQARQRKGGTR